MITILSNKYEMISSKNNCNNLNKESKARNLFSILITNNTKASKD